MLPCQLCIWQRWGYAGAIVLAIIALLLPATPARLWRGCWLRSALLATAALALFHTGVEYHWWQGLASCSGNLDTSQSLSALEQQLLATPVIPCDRPAWTMFGISMAGYDFLYATALGLVCLVGAVRSLRHPVLMRRVSERPAKRRAAARRSDAGRGALRGSSASTRPANMARGESMKASSPFCRRVPRAAAVEHMAAQEKKHLEVFDRIMVDRRVRPTALGPLWHAAGYALGAATALLGAKAAMACTVAVEEVIDEHYARQAAALPESEGEAQDHDRDVPRRGDRSSRSGPGPWRRQRRRPIRC